MKKSNSEYVLENGYVNNDKFDENQVLCKIICMKEFSLYKNKLEVIPEHEQHEGFIFKINNTVGSLKIRILRNNLEI